MNLQTWMKTNKLVDQDVADKLGVTRPYVTRIRNRLVHPNLGVALKIQLISKGEVDLFTLLPSHLDAEFTRLRKGKGTARKPAARTASPEPVDA